MELVFISMARSMKDLERSTPAFMFEVQHSPNNGFERTADRSVAQLRLASGGAAAQP